MCIYIYIYMCVCVCIYIYVCVCVCVYMGGSAYHIRKHADIYAVLAYIDGNTL